MYRDMETIRLIKWCAGIRIRTCAGFSWRLGLPSLLPLDQAAELTFRVQFNEHTT